MAHPTRIFQTDKDLEKVWLSFKDDLKERSSMWEKVQYVGKDGDQKKDKQKLPLTLEGFKRYCWDEKIGCVEQYFTNQDKCYDAFIGICSRIKNEIRDDQITGGLLGFYNQSITQRLNNLKETTENTNINHNQPLINLDPLDDSADNGTT